MMDFATNSTHYTYVQARSKLHHNKSIVWIAKVECDLGCSRGIDNVCVIQVLHNNKAPIIALRSTYLQVVGIWHMVH